MGYIAKYRNELRGGEIYIANTCSGCKVHFEGGNMFRDNYAFIQGGAISYMSYGFKDVDNSMRFINNTDSFMNKSIASYANSVEIIWDNKTTQLMNLHDEPALSLRPVEQVLYAKLKLLSKSKSQVNMTRSILKFPSG